MSILRQLKLHILIALVLGIVPGYLVARGNPELPGPAEYFSYGFGASITGVVLGLLFVFLASLSSKIFAKAPLKGVVVWFWVIWVVLTVLSTIGNLQALTGAQA